MSMNVIPYTRRTAKRRRTSSSRFRVSTQRIPRTVRYNGENKITRTIVGSLNYGTSGFNLASSFFQAINIVYDPTGVSFFGNSTVFVNFVLPNAAELAALYDQLRIDKVELTWSTSQQAVSNGITGAVTAAKFLVANDTNDGIGVASLAEIQQAPNKSFYSVDGSSFTWTCRPKYQRVIYQTPIVSNYEPTTGFVNSNSTIPHYGTKMAITNIASLSGGGTCDFSVKYFLTLRNVK